MEDRTYKTRVELSLIMEIDVHDRDDEDEVGATAENIADGIAMEMAHWYESQGDSGVYIPSWGVRCTDVEPVDYEKGE